jgi:hypothetical protein
VRTQSSNRASVTPSGRHKPLMPVQEKRLAEAISFGLKISHGREVRISDTQFFTAIFMLLLTPRVVPSSL